MAILAHDILLHNDVNYGYWKVRMRANLRGADEDIWTVVQSGWEEPLVMQEDGLKTLKSKTKWTATDYDEAGGIRFIKAEVKSDDKPKVEEKSGSVTMTKENQNTACRNGGLFCRK